jgi:hypothetical protein
LFRDFASLGIRGLGFRGLGFRYLASLHRIQKLLNARLPDNPRHTLGCIKRDSRHAGHLFPEVFDPRSCGSRRYEIALVDQDHSIHTHVTLDVVEYGEREVE